MNYSGSEIAEISVSYHPSGKKTVTIQSVDDAYKALHAFFPADTIALQERFMVLYLNKGNRVLGVYEVSVGGITSTVVDIRLLLVVALKIAATGIVLCHNHPSGNIKPSKGDIEITKKIQKACSFFDIQVLDHLILTFENKYYSLAEEGDI